MLFLYIIYIVYEIAKLTAYCANQTLSFFFPLCPKARFFCKMTDLLLISIILIVSVILSQNVGCMPQSALENEANLEDMSQLSELNNFNDYTMDIQPNTGLYPSLCGVLSNSTLSGNVLCPRGWISLKNETLCNLPDTTNIHPCTTQVDERRVQFRSYDVESLLCRNKNLHCLGNVIIPGNVQSLSLKYNKLSDGIELKETLSHLSELVAISLASNNFLPLTTSLFEFNLELREVDLSMNFILDLPENLFFNNAKLKTVFLVGNQIQYLPWYLFSRNRRLEVVSFQRNNISYFPVDLFYDNPRLRLINFANNNIEDVPPESFARNEDLREINISGNKLRKIFHNFLSTSTNLEVLSMSYNNIFSIPELFLANCMSLEYVNLAYNNLVTLPIRWLHNHRKLETIDLAGNHLLSVPDGAFQNSPKMNVRGIGQDRHNLRYRIRTWYQLLNGVSREQYNSSLFRMTNHRNSFRKFASENMIYL
ncbi:uncharacterized protein LOC143445964 [Clavelina lepadiformis]|uniref:uncharacterized protein LOC143445964 n=1 Tax=Clavelina lepadiformis TaxID=159417 RepID=UPI004042F9F2